MTDGKAAQLTARAALTGALLGGLLALSNVYVVLKTGWSLGVLLTSTLLAFSIFRLLTRLGLVKQPLGILENTAVASVATAAAFMTGGGNMAALPALLVLTGARPGGAAMFAWFAVIAAMGVFTAIPLKRQLIDVERLPFPSSVAAAETLRVMHGDAEGSDAPRQLVTAGLFAAVVTLVRQLRAPWYALRFPDQVGLPLTLAGHPAAAYSLAFDGSLVLLGGGALMSFRTAWSVLLAALLTYGVFAPALVDAHIVTSVDYKSIVQITVWPGAALLVASGFTSVAFERRAIARAVAGFARSFGGRPIEGAATPPHDEVPLWWFYAGFAGLSPVVVLLLRALFGIPVWAGVLSLPLALLVGVVSARVTGETDVTPTKAVGPATQLLFGVALPGNLAANVMGANVTAGVGLHAADLLSDVKVGSVLGASPRQQVVAQLIGVVVGAAVVVPAFALLVPDASALGTPELPAPAVMVWAGVSKALAGGLGGIPPVARVAAVAGGVLGVALAVAERVLPASARRFVPSPSGVGIAMVMPATNAIAMFLGASFAAIFRRFRPAAEGSLTPTASGLIAGESLTGMALVLARAAGIAV